MIDPHFVFLAAAIGLTGTIRYAIGTLRGRTSPNRVTWTLWAAAPLIGFFAQLDSQVGLPAVSTLAIGVGPLLVLIASFVNRKATVRLTGFDLGCGAVAVLSLIIWLGLDAAPVAVVFAVLADAVGAVPTVRKAWADPRSESALFYVLVGVNGTLTLLTLIDWAPKSWAFPVYLILLSLTMTVIIRVRRGVVRS
jgi:hypothetical protein